MDCEQRLNLTEKRMASVANRPFVGHRFQSGVGFPGK